MNAIRSQSASRRGVLLLLVLSALTLFMMLGALMLVLATRARTSARAFATATNTIGAEEIRGRWALDTALMMLIRGGTAGIPTTSGTFESLLADRYGSSDSSLYNSGSRTLASLPSGKLAGRVLTLVPQPQDYANQIVSYRIVTVTGGTVTLDNRPTVAPYRTAPSGTAVLAYINGRDFDGSGTSAWASNEPWDKPGDANRFLTLATVAGSDIDVSRPAFGNPGDSCEVDNDSDGKVDGIWLTGTGDFLPPQVVESGTISYRVSYLVLDLDGRFNVNAHGEGPAGIIGPASVSGTGSITTWAAITGTGMEISGSVPPPTAAQRRPPPAIGYFVDGRLGKLLPPPSSPYTLRLDFQGPRPSSTNLNYDNSLSNKNIASLFTAGELERVLRPFDADASALPPRLAALLGADGQKARMLVTTDSWDTTGLTDKAAREFNVADDSKLPEDVKQGRRFDINNVDMPASTYCNAIYEVIRAAGVNHEKTRQWVANVYDFRDKDQNPTTVTISGSAVTGYEAPEFGNFGGNPESERFTSIAQLLCVPRGSQQELTNPPVPPTEEYKTLRTSLAADFPEILDALTVASPFDDTLAANPWREPGRVNVNTSGTTVWQAAVDTTDQNPYDPATTTGGMLIDDFCFNPVTNPLLMLDRDFTLVRLDRANRLANIATTRSNVFAVWVTVEIRNSATPEDPAHYRRLFAIVDRSIPVGYAPGKDLNARDTLRVLRYLD